jgi:hypothetical protein
LPAVNRREKLSGAFCAVFSVFAIGGENGMSPFAFAGFLINPLAIIYITLRILDRALQTQIALAIMILIAIPFTWLSLIMMQFGIRIGQVVWIAGLLLIIDWSHFHSRHRSQGT